MEYRRPWLDCLSRKQAVSSVRDGFGGEMRRKVGHDLERKEGFCQETNGLQLENLGLATSAIVIKENNIPKHINHYHHHIDTANDLDDYTPLPKYEFCIKVPI